MVSINLSVSLLPFKHSVIFSNSEFFLIYMYWLLMIIDYFIFSFGPCADKILNAVTEMASLFPIVSTI